jgi:hypothetical protein
MELRQNEQVGRPQLRLSFASKGLMVGSVAAAGLFCAFLWIRDRPETFRPTPMAAAEVATAFRAPRVNLSGRDQDVRQVLKSLASQIGGELKADPAIRGKLAIKAQDADFRDLMDNLCTALRCEWRVQKNPKLTLMVTRRPSRQFADLPVANAPAAVP